MNTEQFDIKIRAVEGGITVAAGFKAAGIHAGFRKNPERLDYALVVPDKPCPGAGVFTTNRFCAAPVQVSRANLGGVGKGYGIIAGVQSTPATRMPPRARRALPARARRATSPRRSSAASPSRFWLPPRV